MKPKKSAAPKTATRNSKKKEKKIIGELFNTRKKKRSKLIKKPTILKGTTGQGKNKDETSLQQEEFCRLYATDEEFFGNGVQSYVKAYNVDKTRDNWQNVAAAGASRLLRNVKIINRISQLLDLNGFNESNADKQLLFLMTQFVDFKTKLGALREYNALKNRVVKKMTVEHDLSKLSEAQLDAILQGKAKDLQDAVGFALPQESDDDLE